MSSAFRSKLVQSGLRGGGQATGRTAKLARAGIGIAMIAAGAPAVWSLREASEPSLFAPYLVRGFLFLSWRAAWAVLAAWVWRATRPTRGWRRSAGALAAVLLALSALVSFAFVGYLEVATILWGDSPTLDQLTLLCPGLLVGGVWVLSGLRPRRRLADLPGGA